VTTNHSSRAPRVLLVDDEQAILDGLRRQLGRSFEVHTAAGAEEALRLMAAAAEPFAAVVSDMRMPGMDGVAFLATVRRMHPDTVRLMLTGEADLESTIEAINLGQIHRFLVKPCPGSTLEAALRDAVEIHRRGSAERDLLRSARAAVRSLDQTAAPAEGPPGPARPPALPHEQPSRAGSLGQRLAAIRASTSASTPTTRRRHP
jgi:DNA-binding NtrC family response regulator